jgi:hypothetical protein
VFFDSRTSQLTDIFRIVKVKNEYKDDVTFYTFYDIQDGERPDIVSTKLYGSADYYWTFFMVNDNLVNTHTDWPLSTVDLNRTIEKKYSGVVLTTLEDISTKFTRNNIIEGLVSGARATVVNKDPNLGLIKIDNITGRFVAGEIIRDPITNTFVTINNPAVLFKDAVHHYENANGEWVIQTTIGATPISNTEYEFNENDKKTKIKIIRPQYVQAIADQFIQQIRAE